MCFHFKFDNQFSNLSSRLYLSSFVICNFYLSETYNDFFIESPDRKVIFFSFSAVGFYMECCCV